MALKHTVVRLSGTCDEGCAGISATATLDLTNEDTKFEQLESQRKAVLRLTGLPRRASVFDDVATIGGFIDKVDGALPADFDWMLRALAPAKRVLTAPAGFGVFNRGSSFFSSAAARLAKR